MTRRERAIEIVEDSRQTHVAWLEFQREHSDWAATTPGTKIGSPEHHERCIEGYDLVLAELRGDLDA